MIDALFTELSKDVMNIFHDSKDTEFEISKEIRNNTFIFLKMLDNKVLNQIYDIYPNPNGTISFDFQDGSSLEIGNNTMSYFIERSPITYANKKEIILDEVNIFNDYIIENIRK